MSIPRSPYEKRPKVSLHRSNFILYWLIPIVLKTAKMVQSNICKQTIACNCSLCNPPLVSFVRTKLPKVRLVGIELNPGPKNPAKALVKKAVLGQVGPVREAIAALGAQLGKAAARKKTAAKKNSQRALNNGMSHSSGKTGTSTVLNVQRNAPAAFGQIFQNTVPNANVRVPFSTSALGIYCGSASSGGSGPLMIGTRIDNKLYKHLLSPIPTVFAEDTTFPSLTCCSSFGTAIEQLGKLYKEYQVHKLRLTFVPIKGSQTVGLIGLGVSPDPILNVPASLDECTAYANNLTSSLYERVTIDLRSMVGKNATEERYYMPVDYTSIGGLNPTLAANAMGRVTSVGSLVAYGVGITAAANELLGTLRLEGEIEFMNLAPTLKNVSSSGPKTSAQKVSQWAEYKEDIYPYNLPVVERQDGYTVPVVPPQGGPSYAPDSSNPQPVPPSFQGTPSPQLSSGFQSGVQTPFLNQSQLHR